MTELIYKEEVYAIVGAAMDVYNELGFGFLEAVYREALEIEFDARGIPYVSEVLLQIDYKGRPLKKKYSSDFLVYEKIVLEIKAISTMTSDDEAQLLNYFEINKIQSGCFD